MTKSTDERIAAFESHMSVSLSELAREEIAAGKKWTLLEATGYIACEKDSIVAQIRKWCPLNNTLANERAAIAASVHLTRELERRKASDPVCLSFEDAARILLDALKDGSITAYVNCKPVSLAGFDFREFVYAEDMIGLSPTPTGDARHWGCVHVNAANVRQTRNRVRPSSQPGTPLPANLAGAKRGPKPKWDWLNLMGELVRIAHLDGLDEIGSQADVERWASQWLAKAAGTDAGPADSLVREHIAPIFDAIDRHNASLRP